MKGTPPSRDNPVRVTAIRGSSSPRDSPVPDRRAGRDRRAVRRAASGCGGRIGRRGIDPRHRRGRPEPSPGRVELSRRSRDRDRQLHLGARVEFVIPSRRRSRAARRRGLSEQAIGPRPDPPMRAKRRGRLRPLNQGSGTRCRIHPPARPSFDTYDRRRVLRHACKILAGPRQRQATSET